MPLASRSRFAWVSMLALALALAAALVLALSGPGYRLGWWGLQIGLQRLLRYGAYAGIAAVVLGVGGLLLNASRRRTASVLSAVAAVLVGGLVVAIPWRWQQVARRSPPIHDITTDPSDPPQFHALARIREATKAPNSLDYTEAVATAQRQAYPDIAPLEVPWPPREAFDRAVALARARGWEVVSAVAAEGRLEATDTTFWFGFRDDVVVEVTANGAGSRVNMRSVSRVGRGDVGTNARRVRAFIDELRASAR
ncbi:MAG: DUF1499 domain-containing protein [Vicinamibacterales bacterium]